MESVKYKVSKQWDMITEGKTVIEAKPMYPSHTAGADPGFGQGGGPSF